ncbi:phosphatase PAP2 family protein [Miltoncostaea marina]|uniref:phosphatase PAP2 family protein n=1 Tax=Miltoncostaea marina TaxID=2843215 RepID=UPI001C3DAA50|nr:phosphatase PAP2 family protein [Miltoncostaea marina]
MSALAVRRPPGILSWRREALLFVAAYLAYSLARGATTAPLGTAVENARSIVELQARLGIGMEQAVQEHLLGHPVMWMLNQLYLVAQFAVVPAALAWVYRRRPALYPRLRTTVLATWVIALPVYALFPTAPPRLADMGVLDTVSSQTPFALDSPLVTAFYNPVAAVPSLHAGFAFAVGAAVAASTDRAWIRLAGLAWGPLIALVVIATGNHFVLDVVLGVVAVVAGYAMALLLHPGRVGAGDRAVAPRPERHTPPAAALRIALICPYDWARPGGVRTHVAGLAEALRARGHSVDVLAAGASTGAQRGVTLLGAAVPVRANGSIARIALGPVTARRTRRALESGGYDVVHVHEPLVPAVSSSVLRWRGAPLVATFHMYSDTALHYRLLAPFFRWRLRRLTTRIAVSRPASVCASHVSRIDAVIPNGVWPGAEEPPIRIAPGGAERRILFVGRPEPRKGLHVLLAAFGRLPEGVRLDLIGVDRHELLRACPAADGAGRITAHGRLPDGERRLLLRRADVLCAPALRGESFGIVVAEAMAEGIPVVASAIPGYQDVLTPGCGRLVPPGDPDALADALADLLSDAALRERLGAAGRTAAAPFAWNLVAARVEREYLRALADNPVAAVQRVAGIGSPDAAVALGEDSTGAVPTER